MQSLRSTLDPGYSERISRGLLREAEREAELVAQRKLEESKPVSTNNFDKRSEIIDSCSTQTLQVRGEKQRMKPGEVSDNFVRLNMRGRYHDKGTARRGVSKAKAWKSGGTVRKQWSGSMLRGGESRRFMSALPAGDAAEGTAGTFGEINAARPDRRRVAGPDYLEDFIDLIENKKEQHHSSSSVKAGNCLESEENLLQTAAEASNGEKTLSRAKRGADAHLNIKTMGHSGLEQLDSNAKSSIATANGRL